MFDSSKKYDAPATPYQRALVDTDTVRKIVKTKLARENKPLNPAAIQRQVQALCSELLALTSAKQGTKPSPTIRAKSNDSTNQSSRASWFPGPLGESGLRDRNMIYRNKRSFDERPCSYLWVSFDCVIAQ